MQKVFTAICIAALCARAASADTAEIRTEKLDGSVTSQSVELSQMPDGAQRVVIPAASIAPDVKYIDIVHELAKAKKGNAGYWVFPRGELGTFRENKGFYRTTSPIMPIFGVKTDKTMLMGVIKGLRFEYEQRVDVYNGLYAVSPRFKIQDIQFKPYEDIVVDFYKLEGDDADYSGMGRLYRKMQLDKGNIKTVKEKIRDPKSPVAYYWDTFEIRLHVFASKPRQPGDQTPETEPPLKVFMTFDQAGEILDALKKAGVEKAEFCNAGWTTGGYDGRFPSLFPIEPKVGGEEGFKRLLKKSDELGYRMVCHTANTGAYKISPMWSEDYICKMPDGSLRKGETYWAGGQTYRVCLRAAWEQFIPQELEKLAAYGMKGSHYIDVFTAIMPYPCNDPKHPINRKQGAEYERKIADKCIDLFGGFSSECGIDHLAGHIDYINYVDRVMQAMKNSKAKKGKRYNLVDTVVPLWEIVYHGIILSNTDRLTQNHTTRGYSPEKENFLFLKMVEFGSRPIFYTNKMGNVPNIARAYKQFQPVKHLQKEFMQSHKKLAEGVFCTVYGDGSETVVNYTDKPFKYDGETTAAKDFRLYNPSFWSKVKNLFN